MKELATLLGLGALTALMFAAIPAALPLIVIGLVIRKRKGRAPWKTLLWIWIAIMVAASLLSALGWSGMPNVG